MKKIQIFFILLSILLLSGCYKEESIMTINNDKSVDFEIKVIVEDDFDEKKYITNMSKYDSRGIKFQRINEYGHNGYKISKKYPSIEKISTNKSVNVEIYKYLETDFNDSALFKREESFFYDTYTANFIVNYNEVKENTIQDNNKLKENFLSVIKDIYSKLTKEYGSKKEETTYNNENINLEISKDIIFNIKIDKSGNVTLFEISNKSFSYKKEDTKIELDDIVVTDIKTQQNNNETSGFTFVVNLPKKAIESNATRTSNDGKTMTWVFDNNAINEIKFKFNMQNSEHYGLVVSMLTLLVISCTILIIICKKISSSKKEKYERNNPIYRDYDASIEEEALRESNNMEKNILNITIKSK